jgi:hypothetical protein
MFVATEFTSQLELGWPYGSALLQRLLFPGVDLWRIVEGK